MSYDSYLRVNKLCVCLHRKIHLLHLSDELCVIGFIYTTCIRISNMMHRGRRGGRMLTVN